MYSYAGSENVKFFELRKTLAKMKRGTTRNADKITVKMLANLPDQAYESLLACIKSFSSVEVPQPIEWKTALVTFIPKAGKAVNTDNLHSISIT